MQLLVPFLRVHSTAMATYLLTLCLTIGPKAILVWLQDTQTKSCCTPAKMKKLERGLRENKNLYTHISHQFVFFCILLSYLPSPWNLSFVIITFQITDQNFSNLYLEIQMILQRRSVSTSITRELQVYPPQDLQLLTPCSSFDHRDWHVLSSWQPSPFLPSLLRPFYQNTIGDWEQ